jgi:Ribbon-helix-helix protein, copG family
MITPPKRLGRPSLDPAGRPSTLIGVRLSTETYAAVTKAAAGRRESIQDLIRRALERETKFS